MRGVNTDFTSYELKWTIDAILQHMGFYHTPENPCVMMRVNHRTKSCECIIICQDELYIASNTLQDIIHIVKDKYKIKINPPIYQGSNFPYDPGGTMICYCNLNVIHKKCTYQHYFSNFINPSITYISISLYIQETFYNKRRSKCCIMGSINQDKQ